MCRLYPLRPTLYASIVDGDPQAGRVVYAGKHRVATGRLALALRLPARPAYAVVDPLVRRLDRDRSDNRRRVVAVP